ncbi:MAG TPA: serine protease [Solirubrobacterales bacterium]
MKKTTLGVLAAVCALAVIAIVPAAASATHDADRPIHPGVMTFTDGAQCTSNFVFRDGGGTYIGQAAHCSGTGGATETNGCDSGSLPLGSAVEVDGATRPGTLVYNSWIAMQQAGETNDDACAYNDFALVRIDPADAGRVNPTVPGFGGPQGVGGSGAALGDTVYSYGNSSLRGGVTKLSPKQGVVVQSEGNGWSRTVYTVTPGVPGDSGSGFMDGSGRAIGTLSTLQVLPVAGSNGVGDLASELGYARSHGFGGLALVNGETAFTPDLFQAIINS